MPLMSNIYSLLEVLLLLKSSYKERSMHYFNYVNIGAGKWKVSLKQANATGTIKYAGMTVELGVNSNS